MFIFLIKPFFHTTKKSKQKFKYLKNEKSFQGEIKSIFHHFKGLSTAKNFIRPDSAPLRLTFCPDFFGNVEKLFEKKAKVNFKRYNVTN